MRLAHTALAILAAGSLRLVSGRIEWPSAFHICCVHDEEHQYYSPKPVNIATPDSSRYITPASTVLDTIAISPTGNIGPESTSPTRASFSGTTVTRDATSQEADGQGTLTAKMSTAAASPTESFGCTPYGDGWICEGPRVTDGTSLSPSTSASTSASTTSGGDNTSGSPSEAPQPESSPDSEAATILPRMFTVLGLIGAAIGLGF